jgi:hypothetical protein
MANYLKLNKSYIGNDILENPEFNMLGPNFPNFNFSEIADGTDVSSLSDWSLLGTPTATIEGGKLKVVCSGSSQAARFSATGLTVGKVYNLSFTAEGDLSNDSVSVSGYSVVSAIGGKGEFYFKAQSSTATLYFSANNTSYPATVEYSDISLKETGRVEYVSNPYFKGVANGTDVTTLSGWSINSVSYPATSTDVVDQKLVIVSGGIYEGAGYDLTDIPNGMEVNLKIESVTGDIGNGALFLNGTGIVIPTDSGSVDYTFIKQASNTKLMFRAGFNTSGTTNYDNISIQPTNVFAYAWNRGGSGVSASGEFAVFNGGTATLTTLAGSSNAIIGTETPSYLSGSELIIKFNVLSKSDGVIFQIYDRANYLTVDAELGENEFRYKAANNGTNLLVNVKSTGATDEFITLDNIGLQEVKNQPKLIGVDNVSTVSAPTNSTVVINNGLTDGADTITITYAEADATSTVQMRNFFQDAIVESANANNTGKVIEIKSPVLINDIVAS